MWLNIILFAACTALVLGASEFLAKGLDRVGKKLHLSDEVLGVLTALGADSPEISSAIVALMSNQRDLGVGIVLGSNLFNLAALLGLGAVVAGRVSARPAGTIFSGTVALSVTVVSGTLIVGLISPVPTTVLTLLIVGLYIYVLTVGPARIDALPIPSAWKKFLIRASRDAQEETGKVGEENQEQQRRKQSEDDGRRSWKPALLILPALAAIVLGSIGLIKYATAIGSGWLPGAVLGTFVLASLTGLPNSFTAVRLARSGKGAAVITETFNSNTINILVGLLLPALIFGQGSPHPLVILDLCFLVFMTTMAVVLSARSAKLTRNQGVCLIAVYLAFVATWSMLFVRI